MVARATPICSAAQLRSIAEELLQQFAWLAGLCIIVIIIAPYGNPDNPRESHPRPSKVKVSRQLPLTLTDQCPFRSPFSDASSIHPGSCPAESMPDSRWSAGCASGFMFRLDAAFEPV